MIKHCMVETLGSSSSIKISQPFEHILRETNLICRSAEDGDNVFWTTVIDNGDRRWCSVGYERGDGFVFGGSVAGCIAGAV